ncbi:MAG: hypothetical protein D6814_09910 [Calditrichaeota bacterium]|nr:MAG: hypothetical protein D6814_09910 [Calditrichota bacterium]
MLQPAEDTALTFHHVAYSSESFKQPFYYGLRVGTFFDRLNWAGLELEFIHSKAYARTSHEVDVDGRLHGEPYRARIPMRQWLRDFSFSHGLNFALVNAVGRRAWKNVAFYGRFGLGLCIPHTETTFEGFHREQYDLTFPVVQVAPGLAVKLWHHFQWLAGYKFIYARVHGVRIYHGTANTRFLMHHFVFGVGWRR